MEKIILTDDCRCQRPCVATIGFFDGVHRGHRFLIERVVTEAKSRGLGSTVITFDRHPREVLECEYLPRLLSTNEEKTALLSTTGIERCAVLPFSKEMAQLSARDFMLKIMKERLGVEVLVIGYDNRFGHNRSDGFDGYVRYGREMGIEVLPAQAFMLNGIGVSSSVIRTFISKGEVEMAGVCLGCHYAFSGTVVGGHRIGRELGFPTANILPEDARKIIPEQGAYAVRVRVEGMTGEMPAMMNVGTRPTFDGDKQTLEAHILDFNGDIYGRRINVAFTHKLREERQFSSVEELKEQLERDAIMVREQFEKEKNG
ncbi:MAG: bifunctional riboflavin kinase/FAD synthetase [Prevotella sp.]|uniref:bifunctional riboflavin kinase/FAD synthetase n=1 Tax=Prevotella sp. TaxID=59823 RepID=UPI002A2FE7EA|nr:bifunctional riboflavin kinase/FAD synthetase [Prevotella sp.]MDD7317210.1 bifunctional riboflavin kinase/FAD synthetase [Prevotellaceae bacterium]MDY4019814.1 bifunctional riboflavin kinase/FAD synthetase [Prevotella sp.]